MPGLKRVVVVDGWSGVRSLFRAGVTGVASDRVTVYHRVGTQDVPPLVETTTYVDGDWVDDSVLDLLLSERAEMPPPYTSEMRKLLLDGTSSEWSLRSAESGWAALSLSLRPVATILSSGVDVQTLRLRTVEPGDLDGVDRFDLPGT